MTMQKCTSIFHHPKDFVDWVGLTRAQSVEINLLRWTCQVVCYIFSSSIAGPADAPIWRQEVNLWALAHAQSCRAQPRDSSAALLFKPPPQVQVLIPFTVGQQQGRGVCLGSCELASGWPGEWLTGVGQYFKLIKTKPFVSESRPAMVAFVRWSFHWNFSSYLAPCEAWNQL